jgi:hypothetical protein
MRREWEEIKKWEESKRNWRNEKRGRGNASMRRVWEDLRTRDSIRNNQDMRRASLQPTPADHSKVSQCASDTRTQFLEFFFFFFIFVYCFLFFFNIFFAFFPTASSLSPFTFNWPQIRDTFWISFHRSCTIVSISFFLSLEIISLFSSVKSLMVPDRLFDVLIELWEVWQVDIRESLNHIEIGGFKCN